MTLKFRYKKIIILVRSQYINQYRDLVGCTLVVWNLLINKHFLMSNYSNYKYYLIINHKIIYIFKINLHQTKLKNYIGLILLVLCILIYSILPVKLFYGNVFAITIIIDGLIM